MDCQPGLRRHDLRRLNAASMRLPNVRAVSTNAIND